MVGTIGEEKCAEVSFCDAPAPLIAAVLWKRRRLCSHERWTRAELEAHRARSLDALVRFAVERSPYWKRVLRGRVDVPLADIAPLSTPLMTSFDEVVTDRRVQFSKLEAFVAAGTENLFRGRYWVAATSGSSGRRSIIPASLRECTGRTTMAVVSSTTPSHQSSRVGASVKSSFLMTERFDAGAPLAETTYRPVQGSSALGLSLTRHAARRKDTSWPMPREDIPSPAQATSVAFASSAGSAACACGDERHVTRFVAVTGGPGAGKTAVLELARRRFCSHVRVLPEVATMLFGGGFPRLDSREAGESAQRAIASVQRELERTIASDGKTAVALCDRGTLDGLAYRPGAADDYFKALATTRAHEIARYAAVIHLRTPSAQHFNHANPMRIESASQAQEMDSRIADAWRGHPHIHFVQSASDFLEKARRALEIVEHELPACCRHEPRSTS